MPLYRVQLKQGSRTIVNHIEANSVQNVLNFFNKVSTMKVSEILEVKYQDKTTPPIDDFNYKKLFKGFIRNEDAGISKQIVLQNIKHSVNEKEIYEACKKFLEINSQKVSGVYCSLFKMWFLFTL